MNQELLKESKTALEKERDLLVAELKTIATPDPQRKGNWDARFPEKDANESLEDRAEDVEEYEVRLGTEQSLESRLLAVTHALARIADGTYGTCKKCGKPIPEVRLRANPAAEFDIEHSI